MIRNLVKYFTIVLHMATSSRCSIVENFVVYNFYHNTLGILLEFGIKICSGALTLPFFRFIKEVSLGIRNVCRHQISGDSGTQNTQKITRKTPGAPTFPFLIKLIKWNKNKSALKN